MKNSVDVKDSKIKLDGMSHIALNVKDMDRAEKFYSQTLGFPVIHRTTMKAGFSHIEVDTGDVAIALFESPQLDLKDAHQTMTEDGYLHFAFSSTYDRFDETIHTLNESGVNLEGKPRDWGSSVSVYFKDPDGHQLEINFTK
jgi:catechol 2,3-dioxygenase-like lactoylglutathione lyase family enzyme